MKARTTAAKLSSVTRSKTGRSPGAILDSFEFGLFVIRPLRQRLIDLRPLPHEFTAALAGRRQNPSRDPIIHRCRRGADVTGQRRRVHPGGNEGGHELILSCSLFTGLVWRLTMAL